MCRHSTKWTSPASPADWVRWAVGPCLERPLRVWRGGTAGYLSCERLGVIDDNGGHNVYGFHDDDENPGHMAKLLMI